MKRKGRVNIPSVEWTGQKEAENKNQGNTKFPPFLVLLFAIWLRLGWER